MHTCEGAKVGVLLSEADGVAMAQTLAYSPPGKNGKISEELVASPGGKT